METPAVQQPQSLETHQVPEGERKTITALFADIKGSTELMADLDPEQARAIIDPALHLMMGAAHRYDGYIVQSTGDGIFALFGAPVAHEDHPQRALYAALRMQEELRRYSASLREAGNLPVEARVGVNTGEVVVRSITTGEGHTEYTPIGHTANLGARIQALAPTGSIATTDATRRLCEGYFIFKALGATRIKGVAEPVNVHEVTGPGPLRTRLQAATQHGLTKFVGRQVEIEALKRAAALAQQGHGQIVAVMAEAGIGKSRLFYEFQATSKSGWMVLEAFSVSHGKASAYLPVIDLLRNYFKIASEDDGRSRREKVNGKVLTLDRSLEETLPYLLGLLGLVEGEDPLAQMDAQVKKRRTLEAIKRILVRESLNQHLMVIFEDLHWIDEETQALLNLLAEGVASSRILMLVNYRPEYTHNWGNKTYYTQLRLDSLGGENAEEMLDALFTSPAPAALTAGANRERSVADIHVGDRVRVREGIAALKRLIIDKTEGNPFFMEEIVQALFEQGVLVKNGSVTLTRPLAELKIPPTVQAILASRIDRLPSAEKDLLQTLAVIGKEFPLGLVRAATARPDDDLDRMLRNLQLGEFIYEHPAFPDPEYTFKHALTQEVAYNSVLTERRKAIHERAARAIESVCADSIEDHLHELAHHYGRSENIAKAVEYLRLASEQAFKRSHYDEARARASAALELLEKLPDRLSRNRSELALRLNLGATAITARGYAAEEAQSAFERAAQLGRDLEAIPETFSAIGGLFGVCLVRAQHRRAFDFANELVELAQKDDSLGIDAHFALGTNLFWRARFADSWKNLEQAFGGYHAGLKLANIVAADTPAFAMAYGAAALWHLGYPQKAHELCGRALERIEEVQHPYTSAAARLNVTNTLLLLRNSVEAQREAAEIVSNATVSGFPYMEGIGRAFQQYAALQRKPDLPTVTELANTLTQLREHGARCGLPQVSVALAEGYCALGEPAQALAVLDNVLNEIEDTSEYQAKAELVRLKGELVKRTNLDEAERNFRIAILIAQEQQAKSWELRATMSLARLLAQQGRRDEAGAMLAEIYHWFTEGFDTPDLKDAKALLDELSS